MAKETYRLLLVIKRTLDGAGGIDAARILKAEHLSAFAHVAIIARPRGGSMRRDVHGVWL